MPPSIKVRCRQITEEDLDAVASLLARGFPERPFKYWTNGLERLRTHEGPPDHPRFGYLLEADGAVVGVLLMIFSRCADEVRCNLSSWYVEPAHRSQAALLSGMAVKLKHVTYLNTSAATHTWPILEAQGYQRYSKGQFAALAALKGFGGGRVSRLSARHRGLDDYPLLKAHADAGCEVVVCGQEAGARPFVFVRRRLAAAGIPAVQLVYARDTESFVACAGPLGRHFLLRGRALILCDATAPLAGLPGRFFRDRSPRFFKGPRAPRINDLAFTEMVLFGP